MRYVTILDVILVCPYLFNKAADQRLNLKGEIVKSSFCLKRCRICLPRQCGSCAQVGVCYSFSRVCAFAGAARAVGHGAAFTALSKCMHESLFGINSMDFIAVHGCWSWAQQLLTPHVLPLSWKKVLGKVLQSFVSWGTAVSE